MNAITAVILAAGEATRMRSKLPKALHQVCGRRMIDYPVTTAAALGARVVVVVGRNANLVSEAVKTLAPDASFVEQKERLGTGHALREARPACRDDSRTILVVPGDMPLLSKASLERLVTHHRDTCAAVTLLTAMMDDPSGYGRVVRDDGRPVAIVEHRDATAAQRAIREIGTSAYCFDGRRLWPALDRITPHNDQGEYYLTDVIDIFRRDGHALEAVVVDDAS